jgi:methyl-accepting chemotaxis protein
MHGMFEMHFFFFVGSALLITYRNWKLMLPLAVITIVHHTLFAWLQYNGMKEIYFTQLDHMTLQAFIFHAGLTALIFTICGYWSYDLGRATRENEHSAHLLRNQLENVEHNIEFAEEISKGNLNTDYKLVSEEDQLGKSLLHMRDNLKISDMREKQEKFVTVGITKVGDIIREYGHDLEKLSVEFVLGIVKYLKLNQGGLFLSEQEGNDTYLNLIACYAFERRKFLKKRIHVDDDLLGQCYLEREPIYLTEVPEEYMRITSGLGDAPPRCLYLVPVKTQDEIVGVIELASFHKLQDFEKQFVEKAAENVASAIISSRTTQRIKALLDESQQQTEQMRAQEEEMRQNMEELQATQEEMHRKSEAVEIRLKEAAEKEQELNIRLEETDALKKENEKKHDELLSSMKKYRNTLLAVLDELPYDIFLKDADGKMVLVNTTVAQTHKMSVDEMIGKSDFDLTDAETARKWREQELEVMRKGSETYIFDETFKGKTRKKKSTKKAFYIPHLDQTGLLGIQTEITDVGKETT